MTTIILFVLLAAAISIGFIRMKYGNYIAGKMAMKSNPEKAARLFEKSIQKFNQIDKSYFELAVCYQSIAHQKTANKEFNLSKAFLNLFNAIYYSKENENYQILEKSKSQIHDLYFSFNSEQKEKNLNHLFSLNGNYGSNYHQPRILSIVNNELSSMYRDFEKINNIHFKIFQEKLSENNKW